MGRTRGLTARAGLTALAALLVLVSAGPAAASTNEVAASRVARLTLPITIQDLAPAACAGMDLTTLVTIADKKGAKIQGTNGNDLIVGSAGDDRIDGRNGDDCLVGGAGADQLDGGNGFDACLAGGDPDDSTSRCEV